MTDSSAALDEAFERMAASDFELPNGFVNHGPMACESLDALGLVEQIDGWSRRFVEMVGTGPLPESPRSFSGRGWLDALGDYRRLPEWIGHFDRSIAGQGWRSVVGEWVPRLVPGLHAALFHGVIRTGQAVRAIDAADTPARRAELARALAYWAARCTPGHLPPIDGGPGSIDAAVVAAAAHGARHFVDQPSIVYLHGVTGAMAVGLLVPHLDPGAAQAALAQVRAEHTAMYPAVVPGARPDEGEGWNPELAVVAAESRDAHQVKLVEACRRGIALGGDQQAFVSAARRVTGGSRSPARHDTAGMRSR